MTSGQILKLFESNEEESTLEARKILRNLGLQIVRFPPDRIFEERFDLPFLETEDGRRYFGIQGITRFVQQFSEMK